MKWDYEEYLLRCHAQASAHSGPQETCRVCRKMRRDDDAEAERERIND